MTPFWAVLCLTALVGMIPAGVFAARIAAHSRAVAVKADWHVVFALFGGYAAGIGMQSVTVAILAAAVKGPLPVSFGLWAIALLAAGLIGSAAVAGCTYLHVRMRTARDADYDDRPRRQGEEDR